MGNALYEEASVLAIANALRLKHNGSADKYTIGRMDDVLLNLPFGNIPQYHYAEAGRVVYDILQFKEAHPNNLVFGIITDSHVCANNDVYEAKTARSTRHGAFALETVGRAVNCDFVVSLGDNVWESDIDTDNAYEEYVYFNRAIQSAFNSQTSYRLVGNHDKSNDTEKLYGLSGVYNVFDEYGTTRIRGYGYKDYPDKKVRVICLNTTDYLNHIGGFGMSYEQKDFLLRALDLSDKNDVDDWQILLLSHIPLDFSTGDYNCTADLNTILSAYVNGTSANITITTEYAVNEDPSTYETFQNGSLVYDYCGKNNARIIANVHGHMHTNCIKQMEDTEIWRVSIMNTCFFLNRDDGGDEGYESFTEDIETLKKIEGTVSDTSVSFMCIDLTNQIATIFVYGAGGADVTHSFVYGDAQAYSITHSLTNCVSRNSATIVVEGGSYETVITPEDTEAVIESVVVTMGGVDITTDCYNDGVITIAEVTGDIVITAVAIIPLWTETVSDLTVAPRSTWYVDSQGLSFGNDNRRMAIGVSTENEIGFTDRYGNPIYVIPLPSKASKVVLTNTDGKEYKYSFVTFNVVNDVAVRVSDSGWTSEMSHSFVKGTANYLAVIAQTTDDSSVPYDYDDSQITLTFSNP